MDKNSNGYTFAYALIVVLACASLLTLTLNALSGMIDKNVEVHQKMGILSAVDNTTTKENVISKFDQQVEQIVLNSKGEQIESAVPASEIDILQENKLPLEDRKLPLFVFTNDQGEKSYIIPLSGSGLWGWIKVNLAMAPDLNTIKAATFSHETETPGLGAEITTTWFQSQFQNKTLADGGNYHFRVLKGKGNKEVATTDWAVDGITGATVTADGVADMISGGYEAYKSYFKTASNN